MDSNTALEDWESLRMNPKLCQSITVLNEMGVLPPRNSTWFAHECKVNGRKHAISTISNLFKDNWPNAYKDGKFKWNILTDQGNRTGVESFDFQYLRANINPSDLYTQILTNTSQYRITTDGAGFDNIYFTGDWFENGFNCCIEAAVTAGLVTSKAISDHPKEIFWEQYIPTKD